jgi:alpha-beta hydrolase superfamily lysophospholipase
MTELAPLTGIAEAPAPANGEAEWFTGAGGAKLRAALFRPTGQVRGSIVVSGGRTEALEKYFEFVGELQDRGFVVLIHDWRGQGLSVRELGDRLKGHANGFHPFLEDFEALLAAFADRMPKPWVAFGHSMGATLTLLALAEGESRFSGAILSAPMLGVRTAPLSQGAARWATRINLLFGRRKRYMLRQKLRPDDQFEGNILTHDRTRFERYQAQLVANPDLALGQPTWGWLDFALRACAYLARPERLRRITIPVTIVSAGEERLVENTAQSAAARHLPQGRLVLVPGAYHEILMETDPMRNIFLRALDALLGRAAPEPAKPPAPAPTPVAAPKPTPVAAAPAPPPPVAAAVKPPVAKAPAKASAQPKPNSAKAKPGPRPKGKSGPEPKAVAKKPAPAAVAKAKPGPKPKTAAEKPAPAPVTKAKPGPKAKGKPGPKPKAAVEKPAPAAVAKAKPGPKPKAAKAVTTPTVAIKPAKAAKPRTATLAVAKAPAARKAPAKNSPPKP